VQPRGPPPYFTMRTAQWNDAVSVIDRVTLVLGAFRAEDTRLGVSELARRANLPKSTVSRLVAELVEHRYLERDGSGVRPGLRLFELGELAAQPRQLRTLALATMADLHDATAQTVALGILQGAEVLVIGVIRGRNAPRLPFRVGGRLPASSTALGRALLAYSEADAAGRVAESGDTTRPRELAAELARVRSSGLAYDLDDAGRGIRSVASAILTSAHEPIAAIAVCGRAESFDAEQVAPALRTATLGLGRSLPPRAVLWPL
jgi:IclR family acetate operon transcriptional repressor